jgi:hypothetical protein
MNRNYSQVASEVIPYMHSTGRAVGYSRLRLVTAAIKENRGYWITPYSGAHI